MPQREHFNAKNYQLSSSIQINKELVLRERRGEGGGRNRYIIPRAVSMTFLGLFFGGGEGD